MLEYSVLMFLVAAVFIALAVGIYKGKTSLIHDYHCTNVTDNAAYGKAFGQALGVVAASLLLSGMTGLLRETKGVVCTAVIVLVVGIAVDIICIVSVQRKYNGGLF